MLILLRKISIEGGDDKKDEIERHYQWNHQHAQSMSYHGKTSKENDITEIIDMHR